MVTEVQMEQLTVEEKLKLVDQLWLSMKTELQSLSASPAERELLDERWEAFLKDPEAAITLEEFQRRMRLIRS